MARPGVSDGGKMRLDQLLVAKGFVESRTKAQALILSGNVLVNDVPMTKAGTNVSPHVALRLKKIPREFVSRGGLKLRHAIECFGVSPKDKVCLDVGISTGGFSDCLLKAGALRVYGVDVGYAQTHATLTRDPRLVLFERENFRYFELGKIPEPVELAVMDVSFISVKLLIPRIVELFRRDPGRHDLIVLVKPQFEAGRGLVGKGGIVRDEQVRGDCVQGVRDFLSESGFTNIETTASPITGTDGNAEFLTCSRMPIFYSRPAR